MRNRFPDRRAGLEPGRLSFDGPSPTPMRLPFLAALIASLAIPLAEPVVAQPASARGVLAAAAAAGAISNAADRTAAVNALWASLRPGQPTSRVPYVAADTAVFLWRGAAASVAVAGDHTGWSPSATLVRQGQSDLWVRMDRFDAAARVDYKLVTGGSTWFLDPSNPNRQASGFGPNSELRMSAWQAEPLTVRDPAVAAGTLGPNVTLTSARYTTAPVTYRVWTPAGYAAGTDRLPAVYVTDGHEYADDALGAVRIVLDNLVAQGRVEPCVVVFVDPRQGTTNRRQQQYVNNAAFAAFVAEELVPAVDAAYRTRADRASRVILGTSLGGVFSAFLGATHPGTFGLLGIHSPAFWISENPAWGGGPSIYTLMQQSAPGTFRVAMTTGTIRDTQAEAQRMRTILTGRSHALTYREVPEGHSWGAWRALVDDVLVALLPPRPTAGEGGPEPGALRLDAAPNPSSGSTTLRFHLAEPAAVRLACVDAQGRTVATLADGDLPAGDHARTLGADLAAGVYACRLTAGADTVARTLTVVQ